MTTLPTDIILAEILPKLPVNYTFCFKCVSKSYKTLISTLFFIDILFNNIFLRLPAKSLLRFKCVSKSFNAKISSSEFINLHLRHSLSVKDNHLLILNIVNNHNTLSTLNCFNVDSLESPAYRLMLPKPFNNQYRLHIFGSCNGLLCIGVNCVWINSFEQFMLLNPSTGASFSIPPPIKHPSKNHMLDIFSVNIIGFGYDCFTDDYKVVEIVEYDFFGLIIRDTLVYSLKANSWKVIENVSPPTMSLKVSEAGALINNHLLHWLFPCYSPGIACFDLRREKWVRDVPLPDYKRYKRDDLVHLGLFDGCLCLLTAVVSCVDTVNVWVMKEYGVAESWVKLLGVSDQPCTRALHTYPIYRCKDDILLSSCHAEDVFFKLVWYNIKDKQSRSSEIHTVHGVDQYSGITETYICHGSLVSLPGGNQIRKELRP